MVSGCNSRGQVYQIDEVNKIATPLLNADLGVYSIALGSVQRLANGNFYFDNGIVLSSSGLSSNSTEVLPDGSLDYAMDSPMPAYRTFRLMTLY